MPRGFYGERLTWVTLLGAVLFLALGMEARGESPRDYPCLHWEIKDGLKVNRQRAERLCEAASKWVEKNVVEGEQRVRPCLTVKVGEPCPDGTNRAACLTLGERMVYLEKWDEFSAGFVAQACLLAVFHEVVVHVAQEIIEEDFRAYLDVY